MKRGNAKDRDAILASLYKLLQLGETLSLIDQHAQVPPSPNYLVSLHE
eukprot:CAMPEP_0119485500 /NCGR_PEP_ID=MMETSP1344-20130328/12192_1 /TAXON_ID=236787 /ORGANISM="Florenciella parvula, Strain CCMP2471" /LENGTH=47 /DNA_ID= /DNA_START= /DNA_END= /DNA_ORIENTATION=